ncbi:MULTISPECIES: hypothetical protein [Bacteroides]|jgi:hypothetical protein|uniref:hypothetical protein n=1 Tax=Bacteroides TaxID=816 RepID=UPI0006C16277|nr:MULTISPECIES: hypothetical protein [Bacteroides]MCM0238727.1 hypothetical protein [Bacteroides fragilis]CUN79221.1 Uncharacterised protein [Bacteroides uniformis]
MTRKKVNAEKVRRPSMDDRIKALLKEGPLVALYFNVAVSVFKEHISNMTDEELGKMFENLLHPERIRGNIEDMYNKLNNIKDESDSQSP